MEILEVKCPLYLFLKMGVEVGVVDGSYTVTVKYRSAVQSKTIVLPATTIIS